MKAAAAIPAAPTTPPTTPPAIAPVLVDFEGPPDLAPESEESPVAIVLFDIDDESEAGTEVALSTFSEVAAVPEI